MKKLIRKFKPSTLNWWLKFIKGCSPIIRDWLRKENSYLQKNIREGSVVLDVGCGLGRNIKPITKIVKKIVGIDNDREMFGRIKKELSKFKNVEVFLENAENMRFKDNTFDYVICMGNTFGNFERKQLKILKEMKRVTKENGRIMISVYSENALPARLKEYKKFGIEIKKVTSDGSVLTREWCSEQFSKEKLRKIFKKAGLKAKIIELNPISYICEVIKR